MNDKRNEYIKNLYNANIPVLEIAQSMDMSRSNVVRIAKKEGCVMRGKKGGRNQQSKLTVTNRYELKKLYNSGYLIKDIAEHFDISPALVIKYAKKMVCTMRNKSRAIRAGAYMKT